MLAYLPNLISLPLAPLSLLVLRNDVDNWNKSSPLELPIYKVALSALGNNYLK